MYNNIKALPVFLKKMNYFQKHKKKVWHFFEIGQQDTKLQNSL